ncbi:MAG TPA: PQQ-binding-like beta-propeller repeat protein, partial [Bacteroidales bacterium]|nr:PQQ-binding-like beta-propeller repeat protein [Bacteroidales bacterium]
MKTLSTFLALFFVTLLAVAQDDMTTVWETKLDHKISYYGTDLADDAASYSFAADDKKITVFNNADGSTVWSSAYKDIAPRLRKVDELEAFWESNTIFLFDRKLGKDQIACIDMKTGALLWTSDKYQNVTEEAVVYIPEEDGFAITLKSQLVFIKART